jgi:uncharacterized protein
VSAEERARARDILDAQEGTGPVALLDEAGIRVLLGTTRRIAVVGASPDAARASNRVMAYLLSRGYACVPVNPHAREVLGARCFPTLEAAAGEAGPLDMVNVFRRAEHTPAIARSAVAIGARALWLQVGIVSWEAARVAAAAGLQVVMDRCIAVDHRRLVR